MADTTPTLVVKLDTRDQVVAALWAEQRVWGYLENLQDDQKCCYECGAYEHQHVLSAGGFDANASALNHEEIITDHQYVDYIKGPAIVVDELAMTLTIELEPAMILNFFVNNVFYPNGDYDQETESEWYLQDSDGNDIPKPLEQRLARTMWHKIHEALEH